MKYFEPFVSFRSSNCPLGNATKAMESEAFGLSKQIVGILHDLSLIRRTDKYSVSSIKLYDLIPDIVVRKAPS